MGGEGGITDWWLFRGLSVCACLSDYAPGWGISLQRRPVESLPAGFLCFRFGLLLALSSEVDRVMPLCQDDEPADPIADVDALEHGNRLS